ncbi:MAG TPA: RecQ family ATP-dependent DNA helicase [Myxococcales bacterium]|nr:RecQ family ATP-dependent DNA helicase [Myxococcales bacterium]
MQDVREALRTNFAHQQFRPGQEAIIRSVLSGRPTVAILPTGGGKSLCYQLPAMLLEGTTVVVSPLLALMKDQVDALTARGIAATFVNSSLGEEERRDRQARIAAGEFRLVYVAPERFRSPSFRNAVARLRVPLFAIDEAHCISSWGHDFRPEYQRLAEARGHLRAERVLALTATATPEVRKDIVRSLALDEPQVFVAGFDRPNLFIEVARVSGDAEKVGRLVALARRGGPGLVYAATRRNVDKVVSALRGNGVDALGYHAGMDDAERIEVQDRFLRGDVAVVVATNAFGMGVDKADIRFVAHFDVPRSLEAYYQEIGRAGRDGLPSLSLLLFNYADVMMQKRMIESSRAKESVVRNVWSAVRTIEAGDVALLASLSEVHPADVQAALKLLEAAGHVSRRGKEFAILTRDAEEPAIDFELAALRVVHERQMLDRMVRFCDTAVCRRGNLLRYFGDPASPWSCSACDCCVGAHAPAAEEISLDRPRSRRSPRPSEPAVIPADMDEEVFAALRALRTEIARETKVPPYVVFHDATLRELAAALPQDERGFLAVKGAGPNRWQRYGERVLAITRNAHRQDGASSTSTPAPSDYASVSNGADAAGAAVLDDSTVSADPSAVHPLHDSLPAEPPIARDSAAAWEATTSSPQLAMSLAPDSTPGSEERSPNHQPHAASGRRRGRAANAVNRDVEVVWQLCARGATLLQIAERTRLATADVARHLSHLRRTGRELDLAQLLGPERLEAIRAAADGANGDVAAIRRRLPFAAPLAEIHLALES